MKKALIFLLIIQIIMFLCACGTTAEPDPTEDADVANPQEPVIAEQETVSPELCHHEAWDDHHTCLNCGFVCPHERWKNGICTLCGAVCPHEEHDAETQLCMVCGEKVWHNFYHGVCACGAEPDLRTDYLDLKTYFVEQPEQGTLLHVPYQTPNYAYPDGEKNFDKELLVYLPFGYDASKPYDVLLLLHGQYGMPEDYMTRPMDYYDWRSKAVGINLYDYIFANRVSKPVILVAITTRAQVNGSMITETNQEQLIPEIRNNILPCIVEKFSTYAKSSELEDIRDARDHFGFCGISTGEILAIDCAILKNLDLFGNFILMSGDGRSKDAVEFLNSEEGRKYPIDYLFSACGTYDLRQRSATNLYLHMVAHTDAIIEGENTMHLFIQGGHQWCVWFTGLYNALQLLFPVQA